MHRVTPGTIRDTQTSHCIPFATETRMNVPNGDQMEFFRYAERLFRDRDPAGPVAPENIPLGQLDRITGTYPGTDSIFQLNIPAMYIWRIAYFELV